ncbi:MAG: tyrosine recombinase XerC [Clostridiales bacterium]|nr:tyrosine recombinase XerC [Clostridiales bacterium]
MDYRNDAPQTIRDFLTYNETIRGKSPKTTQEYFLDLRTFFRFIKSKRKLVLNDCPFDEISISDVDVALIKTITLSDIYDYLTYASRERPKHHKSADTTYGNIASTRARKVSSIRSFFKYLTDKAHLLDINPAQNLDSPKARQSSPRYLTLDESRSLLDSVSGPTKERDYCILTLFLNCALRVSELAGINLSDIQEGRLRVLGKGDKERTVYLNPACINALNDYIKVRPNLQNQYKNALFLTRQSRRIDVQTVKWLVKKYLSMAGLDAKQYSAHKLRHTAATLMYQNGVDIRTLQEVLGHKNLDTTMIYTHIASNSLENAALANPLSNEKAKKTE